MDSKQIEYNKLLERYNKGVFYFSSDASDNEKWKHLPNFQKICMELSILLREIGEYTSEEALGGFKDV